MSERKELTFEIQVSRGGELFAAAEAEDPESALRAGQQLFDDAWNWLPTQGAARAISTVFTNNGRHVMTVEGRRPV